jgi:hypothetical protein
MFILLELSSPSRRIFIGSHSLPPLWFAVSILQASILRPDRVKEKRYCGFHDRNSHSINDCRVFRMRIQKSIQEGHLKFDNKMKLDGHPFPQNMVGFSVNMVSAEEKGKVKVLSSARAKQDGSVDPTRQVTVEQVHKEAPRILKSQIEVGESSRTKPG